MLGVRKLRPGSLRWFAAGLVLVTLGVWLGFAFRWDASATGPLGRVRLYHGCVELEYGLSKPLPPSLQVTTLLPWPPLGMHGFAFDRATESRLDWLPEVKLGLETGGAITTTPGPNPVIKAGAASVWRTIDLPLWPAVLIVATLAVMSWRRHRPCGPDDCCSCGYNRAGLAADAKCPECGTVPTQA